MAGILIIGGGGHARVVVDALRASGAAITGIVDARLPVGSDIDGVPVIGTDEDLPRLAAGASAAFVAIGSTGDPAPRVRATDAIHAAGLALTTIVHPSAVIASGTDLADGVFVGAGAVIGTGATLGECAIVNTGAVVDHDCIIGAFAHIAPGAALSGSVEVGDRSHVGTGASVMHGVTIGPDSVVGVGSAVVRDIPAGVVAYGNPCAVVRASGPDMR